MNPKILLMSVLVFAASAIRVAHEGFDASYYFDEGPQGNRCRSDFECTGLRKCSKDGWCQERAR